MMQRTASNGSKMGEKIGTFERQGTMLKDREEQIGSNEKWKAKLSAGNRIKVFKDEKDSMILVLLMVVLIDNIGGVMLAPGQPLMCTPGAHPESFPSIPFGFSLSMNVISAAFFLGQTISAMVLSPLSDKIGRKPVLLMCMFIGGGAYVVKWLCRERYWTYVGSNIFVGLFAGSRSIVNLFIADIYESGKDRSKYMGYTMIIMICAVNIGGLVGTAIAPIGLFSGLWFGFGLSMFGGLLVVFRVVEPSKPKKEDAHKKDDDAKQQEVTSESNLEEGKAAEEPKKFRQGMFLQILFISFMDQCGNMGLRVGLNTIFVKEWNPNVSTYGLVLNFMIFAVVLGMAFSSKFNIRVGNAMACIIGNGVTAAGQVGMWAALFSSSMAPFIVLLYATQGLGVMSGLTTAPMVTHLTDAAPQRRGLAMGLMGAVNNIASFAGPLVFAIIYDEVGSAGMLWTTAAFSAVATILAVGLLREPAYGPMGKKKSEEDKTEEKEPAVSQELSKLDQVDADGNQIDISIKSDDGPLSRWLKKYGDSPGYGKYEKSHIAEALACAHEQLEWRRELDINTLERLRKGEAKVEKMREQVGRAMEKWDESEAVAFGEWVKDYMRDNGYWVHMKGSALLYKAMIINAFPPIGNMFEDEEPIEDIIVRRLKLFETHLMLDDQNQHALEILGEGRETNYIFH